MKKELKIIFCISLILILSLSLVSAGWFSDLFGGTGKIIGGNLGVCSGNPISCFDLKTLSSCKNQQGCSWGSITAKAIAIKELEEEPVQSICSGVVKSCEDFSEKDSCANQRGCAWKKNLECENGDTKCVETDYLVCINNTWANYGKVDGQCGYWSPEGKGELLWVGDGKGNLLYCNSSGSCINSGDKGAGIEAMVVFDNKLWIGLLDGTLQSCDSSGNCTNFEKRFGNVIYSMIVYDNKIWIGNDWGNLYSCNSLGDCINHGKKGSAVNVMEVYNNTLLLGHSRGGKLKSCDSSGNCTIYGDKGGEIHAMVVYEDELWIGTSTGTLFSCNFLGNCIEHINFHRYGVISSVYIYDNKLWFTKYYGYGVLYSCDSSGSCLAHSDFNNLGAVESMISYDNKLWLGQWNGILQSCNSSGSCISFGNKGVGAGIKAMAVYSLEENFSSSERNFQITNNKQEQNNYQKEEGVLSEEGTLPEKPEKRSEGVFVKVRNFFRNLF